MKSFDEALALAIGAARPLGAERIALSDAEGRILAAPVTARFAMPRSDVSAMDGYAVREADLGPIPFQLDVVGESFAGTPPGAVLPEGKAFRIFTGAPVPEGADRVIVQENVERLGPVAHFVRPYGPGRNIRAAGSDFETGAVLVEAGSLLHWRALTAAAAADRADVEVVQRPRVVILATGDELAAPGQAHSRPGAIPESVALGIGAFARANGADVLRSLRLPDQPEVLTRAARDAVADADVVITIGGASVGERDHSRAAFGGDLTYLFPRVAMKPGKPVWLARSGDRLIMGLPGNPASALVTARLFLAPLLQGLGGRDPRDAVRFEAGQCRDPLPANGGRENFLRARRTASGLALAASQDSSGQAPLALADVLIRRRPDAPAEPAGADVSFVAF